MYVAKAVMEKDIIKVSASECFITVEINDESEGLSLTMPKSRMLEILAKLGEVQNGQGQEDKS